MTIIGAPVIPGRNLQSYGKFSKPSDSSITKSKNSIWKSSPIRFLAIILFVLFFKLIHTTIEFIDFVSSASRLKMTRGFGIIGRINSARRIFAELFNFFYKLALNMSSPLLHELVQILGIGNSSTFILDCLSIHCSIIINFRHSDNTNKLIFFTYVQ